MTKDELLIRFPNASNSFIRANLSFGNPGTATKLEPSPPDEPLEKEKVQRPTSQRILVRVTSVRRRLLDEDNPCEKYHVDLCRYAGILTGDAPGEVKIEVVQRKAVKKEPEHTVIEIYT